MFVDPVGILLQVPLFGDLAAADVGELVPYLREKSYARGESVWLEGDQADALYILVEGQLRSYRTGRDGGEVILLLQSGVDVVGEVGLFHPGGARLVSVSAMTPSRCLTLARSALIAFLARHPVAMERMLEQLSTIAGRAAYSFTGVAFDDIGRRVAVALLGLAEEFGEPTPDQGVRIRLRLSQGTLAALVAASRENVNRALSAFVTSGAVSQVNGYFHLHDLASLESKANVPTSEGLTDFPRNL